MKTMLTRSIATLLLLLLTASAAFAGTVTILPMSPTVGSEVTIEYRAGSGDEAWLERTGDIHAVVLLVTNTDEPATAIDVPLNSGEERYRGTFTLPADVVFALVKIGDGVKYDVNNDLYWEILVHGDNGKAVEGAHFRAAMANLGTLPGDYQKKLDQDEALGHLTKETMLYPRNTAAQINTTFLLANQKQITPEEAQARLRETLSSVKQASSPTEALAVANALRQMGQQAEAQSILQGAAERFPQSRLPEQLDLDGLQQSSSTEDFVRRAANHLQQYPNSAVRSELLGAIINASSQSGKMDLLVDFLTRAKAVPAISYYNAVNYMGAIDSLKPTSMTFIEAGFVAAKNNDLRSAYISPNEWREQQRVATSLLHFVKGAILQESDPTTAVNELSLAIEIGGSESDKAPHDMYVQLLARQGRNDEALAAAERAIKGGMSTQGILDTYRTLRSNSGDAQEAIASDLAELQSEGRGKLVERLSQEMMNQPLIDGTFLTMDGVPTKVSDWKGKVVILDFWATWCGPCRKSFPAMQKLYEKYKDHPKVQFAIVNVWERTDDPKAKVTEFLGQNPELKFPIFFDQNDATVTKYGVTGIPTKFYLGKDGRAQFKEVGYLPEEQFIEEATNKIEVLLAQ